MTTPDIAAAMQAAMDGENARRQLASQRPGHGLELTLAQPSAAPAVGKSSLDLPVVGLGYEQAPAPSQTVHASYVVPSGADATVAGYGFQAGKSEPAISVWLGQRSLPARDVVYAGAGRPSLWSRLLRRGRR